jgi:hypothetical protein
MPRNYWNARRFCSVECQRLKGSDRWHASEGGCWIWAASVPQRDGYARVRMADGRRVVAHRVVYAEQVRSLSSEEDLHHRCRQRLCVNPDHLEVTDRASHMAKHMLEDGRMVNLPGRECEWCGESYVPTGQTSQAEWARRRYCSHRCAARGNGAERRALYRPG